MSHILMPNLGNIKFLYHGTTLNQVKYIKSGIDFSISNPNTDFGRGFYLTADESRAKQWAMTRVNMGRDKLGAVIVYSFNPLNLGGFRGLQFLADSMEWKKFIFNNRSNRTGDEYINNLNGEYDYVWGPIADGRTSLIKKVTIGLIKEDEFYGNMSSFSNQLSIHTEKGLNLICFQRFYYV